MSPCQFCNSECSTKYTYIRHMRLHQSIPNANFACPLLGCVRSFKTVPNLKVHIYRSHQRRHCTVCQISVTRCNNVCSAESRPTDTRLVANVKRLIREGRTVSCSFRERSKTFTVASTFSSHVSRNHKHDRIESVRSAENVAASDAHNSVEPDALDCESDTSQDQSDVFPESADRSAYLQNLLLFYLKLLAKYILPESLIQSIINDFQGVHDINQENDQFHSSTIP